MKIILMGYYGYRNIGDDLMLSYLLRFFLKQKKISTIFVFTKENYYQNLKKVEYIENTNSFSKYNRIIKIIQSDWVIWGGGTCFYDNPGLRNLHNYVKTSFILQKRVAFLGVGVGEFKTDSSYNMFKKIISMSSFISVRDATSFEIIEGLEQTGTPHLCSGGDLVFLHQKNIKKKNESKNLLKNISFSGVESTADKRIYVKLLKSIIRTFNATIHFLPAHQNDIEFHRSIAQELPPNKIKLYQYSEKDYMFNLCSMDFHIGMRLHSIILSDLCHIPNIAICYANKVNIYMSKSNNNSEIRTFDINQIIEPKAVLEVYTSYCGNDEFNSLEKISTNYCLNNFIELLSS